MLRFFSALLLLGIAACEARAAECQCPPSTPVLRDIYAQSAAVFVGTVEKFGASALRPGMNEAQIRLMSRFKGTEEIKGNTIFVYSPIAPEKCGMKLLIGQDYLFFTEGTLARLTLTACSHTEVLDNALDKMEDLQRISKDKK